MQTIAKALDTIRKKWLEIPEDWRTEIRSADLTFITVFLVTMATQWKQIWYLQTVPVIKDGTIAALTTGLRTAIKPAFVIAVEAAAAHMGLWIKNKLGMTQKV